MQTINNEVRNKWFIQIKNKVSKEVISICDYGLVYGTEINQKLGILNQEVVDKIRKILDGDLINKETIKKLVGKKVLFKLTDDEEDKGLIGILKKYGDSLIIERDGLNLVFELYEIYGVEEYKED